MNTGADALETIRIIRQAVPETNHSDEGDDSCRYLPEGLAEEDDRHIATPDMSGSKPGANGSGLQGCHGCEGRDVIL